MSNRHADPLDDNLDRWVDDPTAANAARLADLGADGGRWQRWHALLRAAGDGSAPGRSEGGDPPSPRGGAPVDESSFPLPALPPPALRLAAGVVVDAWRDPGLRGRLRADPRSVLTDAGVELASDVVIRTVTVPLTVAPRGAAASAVLELPLPAATAPPADEPSMRRQLRGTPHEWVIWAAFGPFEAQAARPAIAALADVGRAQRPWRRRVPASAWAFAGAVAAVVIALVAAPGILGPLTGAAVGPAQGVRFILALACTAGAVLLLLSLRRR